MDQHELLDRLRRKDAAAQAEFWREFKDPTFRFIRTMVRVPLVSHPTTKALVEDDSDAHDVLEDTFVAALEGIGKFKGSTAAQLQAWLFTIAKRRTIDFYRAKDRQRFDAVESSAAPAAPTTAAGKRRVRLKAETRAMATEAAAGWQSKSDDGKGLSQIEDAEELSRALKSLTEQQRLAILLRMDGHSFKETGEALGISEAAAKMTYGRGLKELRRLMGSDAEKRSEEVTFNG